MQKWKKSQQTTTAPSKTLLHAEDDVAPTKRTGQNFTEPWRTRAALYYQAKPNNWRWWIGYTHTCLYGVSKQLRGRKDLQPPFARLLRKLPSCALVCVFKGALRSFCTMCYFCKGGASKYKKDVSDTWYVVQAISKNGMSSTRSLHKPALLSCDWQFLVRVLGVTDANTNVYRQIQIEK